MTINKHDIHKWANAPTAFNSVAQFLNFLESVGFSIIWSPSFTNTTTGTFEKQYVVIHDELGLVLIFDTYTSNDVVHINQGDVYFSWRPKEGRFQPEFGCSGHIESESIPDFREKINDLQGLPYDAYWAGYFDPRENFAANILWLISKGELLAPWPANARRTIAVLNHGDYTEDVGARAGLDGLNKARELAKARMQEFPDAFHKIINGAKHK